MITTMTTMNTTIMTTIMKTLPEVESVKNVIVVIVVMVVNIYAGIIFLSTPRGKYVYPVKAQGDSTLTGATPVIDGCKND